MTNGGGGGGWRGCIRVVVAACSSPVHRSNTGVPWLARGGKEWVCNGWHFCDTGGVRHYLACRSPSAPSLSNPHHPIPPTSLLTRLPGPSRGLWWRPCVSPPPRITPHRLSLPVQSVIEPGQHWASAHTSADQLLNPGVDPRCTSATPGLRASPLTRPPAHRSPSLPRSNQVPQRKRGGHGGKRRRRAVKVPTTSHTPKTGQPNGTPMHPLDANGPPRC